jgi:hypothetical protein
MQERCKNSLSPDSGVDSKFIIPKIRYVFRWLKLWPSAAKTKQPVFQISVYGKVIIDNNI